MEQEQKLVQRLCKAHRIRYSKHFFPARTAELRRQLFGEKSEGQEQGEKLVNEGTYQEQAGEDRQEQPRPVWILHEVEPLAVEDTDGRRNGHTLLRERTLKKLKAQAEGEEVEVHMEEEGSEELEPDIEEEGFEKEHALRVQRYQRMHREALLEALEALREGRWLYSRRIIGIWNYQREQLRFAS